VKLVFLRDLLILKQKPVILLFRDLFLISCTRVSEIHFQCLQINLIIFQKIQVPHLKVVSIIFLKMLYEPQTRRSIEILSIIYDHKNIDYKMLSL